MAQGIIIVTLVGIALAQDGGMGAGGMGAGSMGSRPTFPGGGMGSRPTFPGGMGSRPTFPSGMGSRPTFPSGGMGSRPTFPSGGMGGSTHAPPTCTPECSDDERCVHSPASGGTMCIAQPTGSPHTRPQPHSTLPPIVVGLNDTCTVGAVSGGHTFGMGPHGSVQAYVCDTGLVCAHARTGVLVHGVNGTCMPVNGTCSRQSLLCSASARARGPGSHVNRTECPPAPSWCHYVRSTDLHWTEEGSCCPTSVCGQLALKGTTNETCPATQPASFTTPSAASDATTAPAQPCMCPTYDEPVCANGTDFANACLAACAAQAVDSNATVYYTYGHCNDTTMAPATSAPTQPAVTASPTPSIVITSSPTQSTVVTSTTTQSIVVTSSTTQSIVVTSSPTQGLVTTPGSSEGGESDTSSGSVASTVSSETSTASSQGSSGSKSGSGAGFSSQDTTITAAVVVVVAIAAVAIVAVMMHKKRSTSSKDRDTAFTNPVYGQVRGNAIQAEYEDTAPLPGNEAGYLDVDSHA